VRQKEPGLIPRFFPKMKIAPKPTLSDRSVLLLEDDTLLRRQIAAHLRARGATVFEAASVHQARNLLRTSAVDFAVLDVHVPDGLGTELLGDSHGLQGAETVVMTAESDLNSAVEVLKQGALDYFAKPFDLEDLATLLASCKRH
jgi:two-component system, NtrC family, nitrogen regulation response regulator GlnG